MKVVVLGAGGMLGSELQRQLSANPENQVFAFDTDLDVTNAENLQAKIAELQPEFVFNCVAFNDVDRSEEKPELAELLNVQAVKNVAEAAKKNGATVIHFSTGYVFDGNSATGYNEDAQPNPQSEYARSKYAGELVLAEILPQHYTVRLNLLFGVPGTSQSSKQSFPEKILAAAQGKESLDLIVDQISTPTYAPDLASACIKLITEKYPFGIYHLPNDGQASWYDWAQEIFADAGVIIKLNPVSASQFQRTTNIPKNSVLLNTKFPKLRTWQQATKEFIAKS